MATDLNSILAQNIKPEWTVSIVRPEQSLEPEDGTGPALSELDEPALVAACLAGRREAFDMIVELHRRAVYQLCYRFVGNHEDASDLSQEVFIRAFRGLDRFRGDSSLGTWLYRIAVNVSLNKVSAKQPQTEPIDARPHIDSRAVDPSSERSLQASAAHASGGAALVPMTQRPKTA